MSRNNFSIFLVISFVVSVPIFLISTQQSSALFIVLLFLLGSYVPAFAAWIVMSHANDDERLSFRNSLWGWGGWCWIGFAILVPSVIWLTVFAIVSASNKAAQPMWLMLATLPIIMLVNYGEEIGWRGYALPFLMKRFSPFSASLIVGVIWGLFHVALNWQRPLFEILTFCSTIFLSVILAWIFINTKSILPGTLFHAMFNAWTQVFINAKNESVLAIAVVLSGLVAGYLFIRYGRELKLT